MKTIVMGNAGAGKSTLTLRLQQDNAAVLPLDDIAFINNSAERRPLADSVSAARGFIEQHDSWVIEGCYADIIEPLLSECEQLLFLNPGVEACVAHCRQRPWEPEKFGSAAAQNAHLESLIDWVRSYETRADEYGLQRHRALFDGFSGSKTEFTQPADYAVD